MSKQNTKNSSELLYTTNQLARACGISRATVLRLEERGLIKPRARYKAGASRMYDSHDVYQVSSLMALRHFGFDVDEIRKFQENNYDYTVLKTAVASKIRELQYLLTSLDAYTDTSHHLTTGVTSAPGLMSYAEPVTLTSDWSRNLRLFIPAIDQAIRQKFQLNWHFPPAIVLPKDYAPGRERSEDIPAAVCIPIEPGSTKPSQCEQAVSLNDLAALPEESFLALFDPTDYFYTSWRGSMGGFSEAFEVLEGSIDEHGRQRYGHMFIAQYAGEFFGKNIPEDSNYLRILQPVRPDTDDKEGRPE